MQLKAAVLLGGSLALMSTAGERQQADRADLFGVWRCAEGALPAVTLNVTDEGGALSGAILFYLIRHEPGKEATSSPGIPGPLLHPKTDGNTLTFEASHRLAHPPETLSDPPVVFHFKLTGPNKAELIRGEGEAKCEMVKDKW